MQHAAGRRPAAGIVPAVGCEQPFKIRRKVSKSEYEYEYEGRGWKTRFIVAPRHPGRSIYASYQRDRRIVC